MALRQHVKLGRGTMNDERGGEGVGGYGQTDRSGVREPSLVYNTYSLHSMPTQKLIYRFLIQNLINNHNTTSCTFFS